MGWLFPYDGKTKSDVVRHVIDAYATPAFRVLDYATKGNALWVALERGDTGKRFIGYFLLRQCQDTGLWGYKDLTEQDAGGDFSCPVRFFDLVPCHPEASRGWREEVLRRHAEANRPLEVGVKYALVNAAPGSPEWLTLTSLRPLRGVGPDGRKYSVPRRCLGERAG